MKIGSKYPLRPTGTPFGNGCRQEIPLRRVVCAPLPSRGDSTRESRSEETRLKLRPFDIFRREIEARKIRAIGNEGRINSRRHQHPDPFPPDVYRLHDLV